MSASFLQGLLGGIPQGQQMVSTFQNQQAKGMEMDKERRKQQALSEFSSKLEELKNSGGITDVQYAGSKAMTESGEITNAYKIISGGDKADSKIGIVETLSAKNEYNVPAGEYEIEKSGDGTLLSIKPKDPKTQLQWEIDTGVGANVAYDSKGKPVSINGIKYPENEMREKLKNYQGTKITAGVITSRSNAQTMAALEKDEALWQQDQEQMSKLPIFTQLSERKAPQEFITSLLSAPQTDVMLSRVMSNADRIPADKISAVKDAIMKDKLSFLIDPELQALKTSLELLVQSIVKEKQGARPSDTDRKVLAEAIGNVAAGKATFMAGLNEMMTQIKLTREVNVKQAMDNYGVDISSAYGFTNTGANNETKTSLTPEQKTRLDALRAQKAKQGG